MGWNSTGYGPVLQQWGQADGIYLCNTGFGPYQSLGILLFLVQGVSLWFYLMPTQGLGMASFSKGRKLWYRMVLKGPFTSKVFTHQSVLGLFWDLVHNLAQREAIVPGLTL